MFECLRINANQVTILALREHYSIKSQSIIILRLPQSRHLFTISAVAENYIRFIRLILPYVDLWSDFHGRLPPVAGSCLLKPGRNEIRKHNEYSRKIGK